MLFVTRVGIAFRKVNDSWMKVSRPGLQPQRAQRVPSRCAALEWPQWEQFLIFASMKCIQIKISADLYANSD